jgi:hypothetical protein
MWAHLQHASIDHTRGPSYITGLWARKKSDHRGTLARIARPTERDAEVLLLMGILVFLPGHGRSDLVMLTSMPFLAMATAVALPMPESDAVTIAYRGSKVMLVIFPAVCRANQPAHY